MKTRLETLIVRGLKTAWLEEGSSKKPILLLLHGYPDGPEIWDKMADMFKDRFQVIRPYSRGTAESQPSPELHRYGLDAEVLDLFAILKKLDPKKKRDIVVVGHDLGGPLAWDVAALLGRRLVGLVIFNSLSIYQASRRLRDLRQHRRSWYMYLMQLPKIPEWFTSHFSGAIHYLAYTRGGLSAEQSPDPKRLRRNAMDACNRYRALVREALVGPKRPSRLKAPVLILWGHKDPFVLPPTRDEVEACALSSEIRILEAGHWPFLEHPKNVHSLLELFFAKLHWSAPDDTKKVVQGKLPSAVAQLGA